MKKKLCVAVLLTLLMSVPAKAQYGYAGDYARSHGLGGKDYYVGLRVGLNVATVHSDVSHLDGNRAKAGVGFGVVAGYQLSPDTPLFLESGLLYMEKGGKGHFDGDSYTYGLNYLELPLVVKYGIEIDAADNDLSVQPFFGGYLATGVGGKIKNYDDRETTRSFSNESFQRFDAGLRLGCGVQFNHLYLELGYEFGLVNIFQDDFDSSHTGNFFVTAGVNF